MWFSWLKWRKYFEINFISFLCLILTTVMIQSMMVGGRESLQEEREAAGHPAPIVRKQ